VLAGLLVVTEDALAAAVRDQGRCVSA
jgi:hypothetical protein